MDNENGRYLHPLAPTSTGGQLINKRSYTLRDIDVCRASGGGRVSPFDLRRNCQGTSGPLRARGDGPIGIMRRASALSLEFHFRIDRKGEPSFAHADGVAGGVMVSGVIVRGVVRSFVYFAVAFRLIIVMETGASRPRGRKTRSPFDEACARASKLACSETAIAGGGTRS